MQKRLPASMHTGEALKDVIEGRLEGGTSELLRLATQLIVEEALEAEGVDVAAMAGDRLGEDQDHPEPPPAARGRPRRRGRRTRRCQTRAVR